MLILLDWEALESPLIQVSVADRVMRVFPSLRVRQRQPAPERGELVDKAQDWSWGSCAVRLSRSHDLFPLLAEWPVQRPRRWLQWVNEPQTPQEEAAMKMHIRRNRPWGGERWVRRTAQTLELQQTLRPRGRPVGWRKGAGPGNRQRRTMIMVRVTFSSAPAASPLVLPRHL